MLNRPIKLITFDADDTLWDFNRMMQRGTEAVARAIMQRVPEYNYITVDYLNDIQHQAILKSDQQTVDYVELRRVAFSEMLREAGHYEAAALADELADIYVNARQERYEFFEDAHSTLQALHGRYPLGYVTNGTTTMELVGLEPYFDFAIYPETLKMRKPRPEIFQHAAQLVGCEPSEIMHVGDDLYADIRGIQSVDGVSVWYNPRNLANTTNIVPDFEIQTLTEIISLLPAAV
jgi:HAD superfamily hydrolase (TIGR01549 family)